MDINALQLAVPPFGDLDVETWFAVLELEFINRNIIADESKFAQLVPRLTRDVITLVKDLLLTPDLKERYATAKARIIEEQQPSAAVTLDKLLTKMELGDRKPSALLREMMDLSKTRFDQATLKELWMNRLPANVQDLLAAQPNLTLQQAAIAADSVHERNLSRSTPGAHTCLAESKNLTLQTNAMAFMAENGQQMPMGHYPSLEQDSQKNIDLLAEIATLRKDLAELKTRRFYRPQKRFSPRRNPSPNRDLPLCWYH